MRRALVILGAALLLTFGAALAQQKENPQEAPPANVPADDAAKKNPVKGTPEGLADAKKLFGYHCAMCHGENGDGKGDLAESMKLQLNDWRNPETISKYTDGALFYIVTNGRGKMVGGEGDRTKEELRWNLVNLVRSFGKKAAEPAKQ
jgi:mono/diheme cytochrome c family protein